MLHSLADVKKKVKEIRKEFTIDDASFWMEEFGEGWNVYGDVTYITGNGVPCHEYFEMSEEEKIYKARARIERIQQALLKMDVPLRIGKY